MHLKLKRRDALGAVKGFFQGDGQEFALLLGPFNSGKTQILRAVTGREFDQIVIPLGLKLMEAIISHESPEEVEQMDSYDRARLGEALLSKILQGLPRVVALNNVEVFYELFPLNFILLLYRSRHEKPGKRTLVVVPGHSESGQIYFIDKPICPISGIRGDIFEVMI